MPALTLPERIAYLCVPVYVRRARAAEDLEGWLRQATHSQLPELKRFARGLHRDAAAVRAAISSAESLGQTEGQVLRLKLIKQSLFGRATVDLLRLRARYRA
jgi:transposase